MLGFPGLSDLGCKATVNASLFCTGVAEIAEVDLKLEHFFTGESARGTLFLQKYLDKSLVTHYEDIKPDPIH